MQSQTSKQFRDLLAAAPAVVQAKAHAAYRPWAENPAHPSLRFKKVHKTLPIYAVRIDLDRRAVGIKQDQVMLWYWIGNHDAYERLLAKLK